MKYLKQKERSQSITGFHFENNVIRMGKAQKSLLWMTQFPLVQSDQDQCSVTPENDHVQKQSADKESLSLTICKMIHYLLL